MGRRIKRFRRRVLFTVFVLLASAAFYVGEHFYRGGTVSDLSEKVQRHYASAQEGWTKTQSIAGSAKDRVQDLVEARPAVDEEQGSIAIYFAPNEELNPWGVDDRFENFIQGTNETLDCALYDLELESIANALITQNNHGVIVRIVSDSHYEERDAIQACIASGIPVLFDQRSPFMHNKFCIADGTRVWTGSTNMTSNGVFRNNNNAVEIESEKLSENYTAEFEEMFSKKKFGGRSPKNTKHPALTIDGTSVENYFAPEDKVQREIISEIKNAQQSIEFMAFSFTSTDIAEAMADRIGEGVRVRGLFEKRNAGSTYSRDEFLADAGAKIYYVQNPNTMHHKVIVIDHKTVVTGSYNFSKNAETKNDENVLILHNREIAKKYVKEFESLL